MVTVNLETLEEHFFSKRDKQETNKFYKDIAYEELVLRTIDKEPFYFLTCSDKNIDTLIIDIGNQLLGLSFLKNEGDLDGDGADEVSYLMSWM